MGRPRKPTNVKIHEGNRGRRNLNPDAEPQPALSVPARVPSGLSTWARTVWTNVVEELDRLSLLTIVDHAAFEAAIRGADQAHGADQRIRLLLEKINRGKGEQEDYYRLSIMNSVSKKGWQQYKAFCTEFGMTPASRTRLATDPMIPATTSSSSRSKSKMDPIEAALCGLPN